MIWPARARSAPAWRRSCVPRSGPGSTWSSAAAQPPGKTTLLRTLCGEIGAEEHVVTIEEEYELGLHLMPGRHRLVTLLEARYPNAEGAGRIDLRALVNQALRQSPFPTPDDRREGPRREGCR